MISECARQRSRSPDSTYYNHKQLSTTPPPPLHRHTQRLGRECDQEHARQHTKTHTTRTHKAPCYATMPPATNKERRNDAEMRSEDEWVDEGEAMDEDEQLDDIDVEDEADSLARLSAQYRRFSDARRSMGHEEEEEEEQEEDENQGEDDDIDAGEDRDDDEEDDYEDDENPLAGALRALANARAGNAPGDATNAQRGANRSLAENMARMFPEAMGLIGGFNGGGSRLSGLIDGLFRRDDPYLVLETLNELSERLLMMNGLLAERGLPATRLSQAIVDILNEPMFQEQLELQLVACRCLYNFLEINIDYVHNAVAAGAIEALQSKLFEISFIDLAEQALQTLEFMSRVCGTSIFRKNCLGAVLQYLDFFTIHAQRKALTIVANSVKFVKTSEVHLLEEVLPTLQRILVEFTDPQELESAWLAISRIVKNFANTTQLEKVVTPELLKKMIQVISNTDTTLSTNLKLLSSLSICVQNNNLSIQIIKTGQLSECITAALSKYKKNNERGVTIETLMAAPKDLIISILDLIIYTLPPEDTPILTSKTKVTKDYTSVVSEYKKFINDIFTLLINIHSSSVLYDIRRRVSVCLIRIVSSLDDIRDLKDHLSIINLLASIVIQNKSVIRAEKKDHKPYVALLGSLILTHSLIEKNPDTFITEFEREGLLADTLSLLEILRQDDMKQDSTALASSSTAGDGEHDGSNDQGSGEEDEELEDEEMEDEENDEVDGDDDQDENDEDDEEDSDHSQEQQQEGDDDDDQSGEEYQGYDSYGRNQYPPPFTGTAYFAELSISQLLTHLTKLASQIEQVYLSQNASGDSKLEHLRLLDEICGDLNDSTLVQTFTFDDWVQTWENFLKSIAHEKYVISSFELISSGALEILSSLFNKPEYGSYDSPARRAFITVFKDDAFLSLVKKLQESLTRSESFEILGCGLKTGDNRAASLGKQIKIKLTNTNQDEDNTDESSKLFEGMNKIVVLVHAIASFTNVGTFLKRRTESPFLFGARQASVAPKNWYVEFLIDGEVIPQGTTIYGALYKHCQSKNANFDTNRFWYDIHNVEFRKVDGTQPSAEIEERYPDTGEEELDNLNHPVTVKILNLLKVLYDFRTDTGTDSLFLNFKLTAKLNRQLEEPLIVASGILPSWSIHITRKFPFLFPLETRIFFLQSTSFGYSRLIQHWSSKSSQDNENNNNNNNDNGTLSLGRPSKHKVRVSRQNLLKNAVKVLEKLGAHPSILEVEFVDEVGTGLGPTLEFYSNVCHAFAESKHGLWRDDGEGSGYVHTETGLFPAPLIPTAPGTAPKLEKFKNLGRFVARALLDSRILDFNFNPLFFEACAAEVEHTTREVTLETLRRLDKNLYQSLKYMKENPSTITDMGITFVLPGYDTELVEGGSTKTVNEHNVNEYIQKVVDFTLNTGITEQVECFVIGFSEVFPYYNMLVFSPYELVKMLGNGDEDWSYETLLSSIHADHGYNVDSTTIQNLLRVMSSFDLDERRAFLKFMTGSPRLPIGGFKNLKPEFTVVLKHEEDGLKPDDYLPSVMTCANYLKLPNYTSLDVLQERLLKAMGEGADVFLLS